MPVRRVPHIARRPQHAWDQPGVWLTLICLTLVSEPLAFWGVDEFGPEGREGDVGDCFYNYTAQCMASWSGFDDGLSLADWRDMDFDIGDI